DRRGALPAAGGRVLLLPVGQGAAGPADRGPGRADHRRAGHHPAGRGGRGRGPGRGVRHAWLLPAVLRAGRRRPGGGHQPDRRAGGQVVLAGSLRAAIRTAFPPRSLRRSFIARQSRQRRGPPRAGRLRRRLAGSRGWQTVSMARPLGALPKAHLHLHFTGSMRHATLVELAGAHGVHLPEALRDEWPPQLSGADERGWFRFQRLYDTARSVLRTEADLRRLLLETAQDERAEGSGWLEIQVDPSGYAARFGGLTAVMELILDGAAEAAAATGVGIGVIIAANRIRHPLDARTRARLAARMTGQGVTGFGLSNDERRGRVADFAPAFRIAERAGLLLVPHGGELAGPASVRACLDEL